MRLLFVALFLFASVQEAFSIDQNFKLSIVHMADQEAAMDALFDAPRASAVVEKIKSDFPNTVFLSSGDNYISGPFFKSSTESSLANLLGPDAVAGMADILIQNAMGVQASALGNHEFDIGPEHLLVLLVPTAHYEGAKFPYLSANIDFSQSVLSAQVTTDAQAAEKMHGKIAKSAIIEVNGEKIGVVGATTTTLPQIQVTGNLKVFPRNVLDFPALAKIIQKSVDELTLKGINKIVLLSHMQDFAIEEALAPLLKDVDVIIGGGSDTILADSNDRLRAGDESTVYGKYPIWKKDLNGNDIAVVNTDGQYRYVGRLVLDFNDAGEIQKNSYDPVESGVFATDEKGVQDLGNPAPNPRVVELVDAIKALNLNKDKNIFGYTTEYLDGRKPIIRSQATNLGKLVMNANLWYAKKYDSSAVAAISNSGGIRASIGEETVLPGSTQTTRMPPSATSYKPAGAITQLLIESTLAFNNTLCLVSLTPSQIKAVLEEGVKGQPNAIGAFPQVANIDFKFDASKTLQVFDSEINQVIVPGQRISEMTIDGKLVYQNGLFTEVYKNSLFRIVTGKYLLENAGDNYPFRVFVMKNALQANAKCLYEPGITTGGATFTEDGKEQDALAEYLLNH
jgi:2',3'-cyclic-nucleotide 2'-phosphodiesterase (5'-nucleotidase family)